jgi:transcriptional regulator with XRE-family HTH domain
MITRYAKLIKKARLERGLTQSNVALQLAMSRPSYVSIEQGKRELTVGEFEKLATVLGLSRDEIESGESPDYLKYKQMILLFLRQSGTITKTKLAKLLYFADFAWFYSHLHSMSGMQYRKIKYGPVADSYFRIIDEMFDAGEINIENKEDGAMLISETRSGAKIDVGSISADEQKLIMQIEKKWKGKRTTEIVDFTHKQFPYLYARDNEIVSYGLFTQENPDEIY